MAENYGRVDVIYEAICGLCGATEQPSGYNKQNAEARLRNEYHWVQTRKHGWLCPDCAAVKRERNPHARRKQVWVPPEENPNLEVLKELPDGVAEERISFFYNLRQATGRTADGVYRQFHFCPKCDGWIPGLADEHTVNTLNPGRLAGRKGIEYYCRRCGYQIAFHGRMS